MLKFFKKEDKIEKFWTWFIENEKRFRKFEENPDKYLTEILTQLKKIKNGLAVELEPEKQNIIGLTISADGDRNSFDLVQQIVSKAPKIDGWAIIAFRQRMDLENFSKIALEVEGIKIQPAKMKFLPIIDGDTLDIIVYVKGVSDRNYDEIAYGGLLMIDNILGEFDCVTKVRSYDFQNMPTKKEELNGLLPLLELALYVDKFHNSKMH